MIPNHALLAALDQRPPTAPLQWDGWTITPIIGGANNRLYQAQHTDGDAYAIKFTLKDSRDRAGREYTALTILDQLGVAIAPRPVLLERERYSLPVVVETWLTGEVIDAAPTTFEEWDGLLTHLAAIHAIRPQMTSHKLSVPVLNADSVTACHEIVQLQWRYMHPDAQTPPLHDLFARFERALFPDWELTPASLCRCDPNPSNFVRDAGRWYSIDWEYCGWGDAAFEIGDIMAHPSYREVSDAQWDAVIDRYCQLCNDRSCAIRIRVYHQTMIVWWVMRFARLLYEVPRGLDPRLMQRPPDWIEQTERKFAIYLARAEQLFP
ncbi:MAG: aminoglycoside phosphotransferase family protein [Anaerolineae bacterium]|jgi:aminoglycoside phosphotransferase (APT) family kinase protein|nr:aminoglycoside phosphotransferase family protein [Anaerolineae bacterium]